MADTSVVEPAPSEADQGRADDVAGRDQDRAAEYRKDMEERLAAAPRLTLDSLDPTFGWTAQAGTGFDESVALRDGQQLYVPEQLPDPVVLAANGLRPVMPDAYVIKNDDSAVTHPKGPDVLEMAHIEQSKRVTGRVIDESPMNAPALFQPQIEKAEPTTPLGHAIKAQLT